MAGTQSERKKEERKRKKKECEQRRRDKIKSDPVAYEAAKAKERERWQKRKAEQKVKTIENMTPREQRKQRAIWRKEYRAKQQVKKRQESAMRVAAENSPPTTDDESLQGNVHNLDHSLECPSQISGCSSPASSTSTRQKVVGERLKKRNYSLLKRVIENQQKTIKKLQIKLNTLRVQKSRNAVRISQRDKEILPSRARIVDRSKVTTAMRKKDVLKFLESDENSRIMPGKKDTITRNQVKKQRRLLSDTLRNLFEKFISLGHPYKINYPTFCRLKPFWILEPNISKRETCLCSTHENFQFIIDKLHISKLIREKTSNDIAKSVTCSTDNDECMMRNCPICCHKVPALNTFEDGLISYKKWTKVSEQRIISGVAKKVSRTIKKDISTTKVKLITEMINLLPKFLQHKHAWNQQAKTMSDLRKQLQDGEVLIHMDFSENYMCKYSKEIQSVHFGASRQQITLHTVVTYHKSPTTGDIVAKSFCSLSESLRHDACAVFAHLKGILSRLLVFTPINILHILTDSPSTQYRNKKMFYLFANHLVEHYSLQKASWHFHEAGHGKGAPDGIGAYVKRTADRHVALGKDIKDLEALYKTLTAVETKVDVFLVKEEEISVADELLSKIPELKTIKNTMRVHQI
ncbi:uncharacterized protein LOC128669545 [Plodia interpunctella]|uniref:uncharacterized protein LOC128669545 n=1 Tax=Plodia interpunctella TaxID=58824 RepID=UPI0023676DB8|nr:uncharacterized protein LOC128669545 [Plodia interpunctella]